MTTIRTRLEDAPTAIRPTAPDDAPAAQRDAYCRRCGADLYAGTAQREARGR